MPEHAYIWFIDVRNCVNLTNLVIQPPKAKRHLNGAWRDYYKLVIDAFDSGLRNITAQRTMINNSITLENAVVGGTAILSFALAIQWTELKLPKVEIRTHTTANGKEVEIIWRAGTLQIADAVSGEWRDHSGSSPYRVPLASAKDMQFFRIKPEEEEEPDEESQ